MNENVPGADRDGAQEPEVVVVGGGAAGLSAALVLGRARRRVVVVDAGEPRNAPASHMHGFLGSDGLSPAELLRRARAEVAGYGIRLQRGTVAAIGASPSSSADTPGFTVTLDDGSVLATRRVLVTTGLQDEVPEVPGVRERWGRDVLHCPYCHGYEVRDQPVALLAGGSTPIEESLAHAHLVRQWSRDVVFLADGAELSAEQREGLAARDIGLVEDPVAQLVVRDDALTGVQLASGQVVPRVAVFVRPRLVAHDSLLVDVGCARADNGWVSVDATGATSVPGVWAAGNAVDPRAQVITAAGEGSAAAIAINNGLVEEDLRTARRGRPAGEGR